MVALVLIELAFNSDFSSFFFAIGVVLEVIEESFPVKMVEEPDFRLDLDMGISLSSRVMGVLTEPKNN